MAKMITLCGQLPRKTRMPWSPKIGDAVIFLMLATVFAAGKGLAGHQDSTAAANSTFSYKPYNEAEIKAAIQKPLTVDDCIRIALAKNIELRLAQGDLRKAEVSVSGSYGKFLPEFILEGSKQRTQENRPFDPEKPEDPTEFDFDNSAFVGRIKQNLVTGAALDFTADLRRDLNSPDRFGAPPTRTENRGYTVKLTQPLLRDAWFIVARSPITLAQYDRQSQEKTLFDAKLQTVFAVKRAFYEVLLQRELVKVHQGALQRDSVLVRLSESKLKVMLATRRDVLSAEIRMAEDWASFINSQTDYQRALDALKDVMGLPIEMPIELADMELSYSAEPLDEAAMIRLALKDNPLIQGAEVNVRNSRLQRTVAKNQLLPRLDLSIQYNGQFDSNTDQNKNVNSKDWQATLSLSYPFLDRAAHADAEEAQIAVSQEEDKLVNLQRQIILSVRDIVRSTYSLVEEINAIKRTIEAAEQKVAFATTMFNLGRASNLDITDAQEAMLKAQTAYVRKLVDYHAQLVLLESITGRPATR